MKIWTPYESMEESAKLCPEEHNIKILLRHSIRQDIEDKTNREAQLTREGIKIAERYGKELSSNIGTISSSLTQRCMDTCFAIINGYNKTHLKYKSNVLQTKMLQNPHIRKVSESKETWGKLGLEGIFDGFAQKIEMPGIYDLETSVNRMINYIFETGNQNNTIDIFCTHDFQLAMLLLFINGKNYDYKKTLFDENDNWPFMLEGIFLWKNNDNIILSWRGKINQL
jgi:broad specificity phosphatase PhoE